MNQGALSIRRMTRSEIDLAIDWAEAEGWNPGIHDADCFYAADPNGFFIGLLDDEPVAMVSAVAYEDSYGFMGFYIVKPEVRNRTYGAAVGRSRHAIFGKPLHRGGQCQAGFGFPYVARVQTGSHELSL